MENKRLITPKFYKFLKDVAVNNNCEWFRMHKTYLESYVFNPFKELTETVIALMQQVDPEIQIDYKQAILYH